MGQYLIWLMRYSDALRKMLDGKGNVNSMSYFELLQTLEKPENLKEHKDLAEFLESLNSSKLSVEERAAKLEENFTRYFKAA